MSLLFVVGEPKRNMLGLAVCEVRDGSIVIGFGAFTKRGALRKAERFVSKAQWNGIR